MNRSAIVVGFFVASFSLGASGVACGGNTPPADVPASSATAPASSAPVADIAPTTPAAGTTAPAPTADPPAPPAPPPVEMPPSFVTAQTNLFAFGDRLNDAITGANGDCAKMGTALNKVVSDAAFPKAFKGYIAEVLKLKPEQRDAAKAAWEANQKKYDNMGEPVKACAKTPGVKAATDKMKKIFTDNLKPLLEALAGAGAAPTTPTKK